MRRPYSPRKGKNDHERRSLQVCWGGFPSRVFWAEKQWPVLKIWRKKRHGNLKRTRVAWADVKTRPAERRQRGPERCGSWLRNTRPGEEASGWLAWLSLFSPALLGVLWYCLVYYSLPSISSECRALNRFLSCFILRVVMLCAINICPLPDYWKRCNGGTHRGSLIRGHARLTGPAGRAVGTMTAKKKRQWREWRHQVSPEPTALKRLTSSSCEHLHYAPSPPFPHPWAWALQKEEAKAGYTHSSPT